MKEILGLTVLNTSIVEIPTNGTVYPVEQAGANQRTNVLNSIADYYDKVVNKNIPTANIEYYLNYPWTIPLSRYPLGTITLKSYEKSGIFFNQTLVPNWYRLNFFIANALFNLPKEQKVFSGNVHIPAFPNKNFRKIFNSVLIEGISTELSGFFQPSDFGKSIVSDTYLTALNEANYLSKVTNIDGTSDGLAYTKPYTIRIILAYI